MSNVGTASFAFNFFFTVETAVTQQVIWFKICSYVKLLKAKYNIFY